MKSFNNTSVGNGIMSNNYTNANKNFTEQNSMNLGRFRTEHAKVCYNQISEAHF